MISVLQASAWYPPKHLGGTEVYLSSLVRELRGLGISSRIVVPLDPHEPDEYKFDGTTVRAFPVNPDPSRAELRGEMLDLSINRFRQILSQEPAEIYHQHSWTRGLGASHLRAARESGFKTVLTLHTASMICLRGTMMRFGNETCDGRIDPKICGACWCEAQGAPPFVGRSLVAMSPAASAALGRLPLGRAATALSSRWLGEQRRHEFARAIADADRIVAVCRWLFDALAGNGVPTEKLVLSRQGIESDFASEARSAASIRASSTDRPFHLLYLGRWHPLKGIDVLVWAMRRIAPEFPIALSIQAAGDGPEELAYAAYIRALAAGDHRIAILPPAPRQELANALRQANALAVPSLGLETGPLVVLEAKAAGLPVIGSRLGGIAELVDEPEDGMLVPPGDVTAWAEAITSMATVRSRRAANTAFPVRTMRDVAREMFDLYDSLCSPDTSVQRPRML